MINENWIYLGTAIGAAGAAVYLRDTLRGTTQPNRVTWLLWAVAPLLAAAVEFNEGVGLRALPTFMVGFMPLLIFIGSFHNSASVWKVRRMDYACGAVSVVGTIVWLVTRDGVLAISAAIAADFLAGIPDADEELDPPGVRDRALLHRRSHQHGHPFADSGPLDVRRGGLPTLCRVRGLRGIISHRPRDRPTFSALPSSRGRLGRAGGGNDALSPAAW